MSFKRKVIIFFISKDLEKDLLIGAGFTNLFYLDHVVYGAATGSKMSRRNSGSL